MGVFKRGSVYYYRFMLDGKEFCKSCRTSDRKLALQKEQEAQREAYQQIYLSAPKKTDEMLLSEAYERIYREKWAGQKDGKKSYQTAQLVLGIIGDMPLQDIDGTVVSELRTSLADRSPATRNRYFANLKVVLRAAWREWGILDKFPHFRMEKEQHRMRTLSVKEENAVMKVLPEFPQEFADLFVCLLDTGRRLSEILNLTARQVDLDEKWIDLGETKNGEEQAAPMSDRVYRILSRRCEGLKLDEKVWSLSIWSAARIWQKVRTRVGLSEDVVLHSLRHTTATRLADQGENAWIIKRLLGHSTIATTQKYVNLKRDKGLKQAVDRLRANNR